MSYCLDSKGYRLIDLQNSKRVLKARNVTFIENAFPVQKEEKKDESSTVNFGQKKKSDLQYPERIEQDRIGSRCIQNRI